MKVLYIFPAAAAVLLLSGCSKAIDYIRDNPNEVLKQCQVQTLQVYSDYDGFVNVDYNAAGNPADMLFHFFDSTGPATPSAIDNHFRYDKRNRLTDYLQNYVIAVFGVQPGALLWDRYSYPRANIVVDSFFTYGDMLITDPNPPISSFDYVRIFQLDGEGRIIKITQGSGPGSVTNFSYDRNGNLVIPDVTYDSTVNPYRTNAVWMFVFQNYSVNNPHAQSEYGPLLSYSDLNPFGLPQVIAPVVSGGGGYLFGNDFYRLNITYACSCTAPSLKGQPAGGL
jgi:hypothetical protein